MATKKTKAPTLKNYGGVYAGRKRVIVRARSAVVARDYLKAAGFYVSAPEFAEQWGMTPNAHEEHVLAGAPVGAVFAAEYLAETGRVREFKRCRPFACAGVGRDYDSAGDTIRKAARMIDHEGESLIDQLPTVDAVLDYLDLWAIHGTEFLDGIIEGLEEGDDPTAALDFADRYGLTEWRGAFEVAIAESKKRGPAPAREVQS